MKTKLSFILLLITISCKNRNAVDSQIEKIIYDYSKEYSLKYPNVIEELSVKQSYEIGFFKNNEIDSLFYIVKQEAYAFKELSFLYSSVISDKLGLDLDRFIDYPHYMGSFYTKRDSIPIHIYDITDKYGREFYDFNNLSNFDFKDFIITEEHLNIYRPNLWIYKIKNDKFIKIAETDTMSYDVQRLSSPKNRD